MALSIVSLLHPISLQPSSASNSTIRNSTLTPNAITLWEMQRERVGGSLRVRVALALQLKSFAIIVHISFCTISKSTVSLFSEAHVAIMSSPLHRNTSTGTTCTSSTHIGVHIFFFRICCVKNMPCNFWGPSDIKTLSVYHCKCKQVVPPQNDTAKC